MSKILIEGGNPLFGAVSVHGSKNAVLPILAATVLNGSENTIDNCPCISDVKSSLDILEYLGCAANQDGGRVFVNSKNVCEHCIPQNLMCGMRSSIIFLGAILSRLKKAVISHPGGCELGARPIDLHIKAFRQLGVEINEEHGFMHCRLDMFKPGDIHLEFPSVGATENIMLAAARACDGKQLPTSNRSTA